MLLKLKPPPHKRQVIPRKFKKAAPPPPRVDWQAAASTHDIGGGHRLKLHVTANPKKPGSAAADLFSKYVDGMTVDEAMKAGITAEALAYDRKAGFVSFHPLPSFMRLLAAA
jgi:hypothetical protein